MIDEEPVIEIRISPQQAGDLVNRLVSDSELRARLTGNPQEELARYGISVPPTFLPEQVELPSPEEIRQLREVMDSGEFAQLHEASIFGPLSAALLSLKSLEGGSEG